jgi:hypothetical protein
MVSLFALPLCFVELGVTLDFAKGLEENILFEICSVFYLL